MQCFRLLPPPTPLHSGSETGNTCSHVPRLQEGVTHRKDTRLHGREREVLRRRGKREKIAEGDTGGERKRNLLIIRYTNGHYKCSQVAISSVPSITMQMTQCYICH